MSDEKMNLEIPNSATFIKQPANPMQMLAQWSDWDAKQQQIIRQSQNIGSCQRAMYTPSLAFNPTVEPVLAPIANVDALQTQIDTIAANFSGVRFDKEDIAYRKNFLATVDGKIQARMNSTMIKCAQWQRQKTEYQSLVEYDAEITRLSNEIQISVALIGGCIGNLNGEALGEGRADRKERKKRRTERMDVDASAGSV